MMLIRIYFVLCFCFLSINICNSQRTELNVSYISDNDSDIYKKERCKLDIRYFPNEREKPVVIFFHGGGLNTSEKYFPFYYRNLKYIEIAPNYRLSPKALCPSYIEDAAEAVAWVWNNIETYGGDKHKIIVTGNSAGAYLATMLALDSTYLMKHGVSPNDIWIYFIESAQMTTHFTVLKERGINVGSDTRIIDQYAPLFHKRYISPYIVLVTGDRNLDMAGRYDQNIELYNALDSLRVKTLYWEFPEETHTSVGVVARSKFVNTLKDSTFFEAFPDYSDVKTVNDNKEQLLWDASSALYTMDGKKVSTPQTYTNLSSGIIYLYKSLQRKSLKILKLH